MVQKAEHLKILLFVVPAVAVNMVYVQYRPERAPAVRAFRSWGFRQVSVSRLRGAVMRRLYLRHRSTNLLGG